MDSYTTIWNNFCKSVTKAQSNNQKEMAFEKSTMIDLLSGLGWSQLRNNLVEQKPMPVGRTEVFADFVLEDANTGKKRVVIELKRPNHNQTQDDIKQLSSYMKLSYCSYGLYIGEKIEIYYNRLNDDKEPARINSINYTLNNKEGIFLLKLLQYDSFDSDKWKNYCEGSIKLLQSVDYWTSENGKEELFQFILDKTKLSSDFSDRLRTLLNISVEKKQFKPATDTPNIKTEKGNVSSKSEKGKEIKESDKFASKGKNRIFKLNGQTYNARDYALAIVKELISKRPNYTFAQIKSTFPKSFNWGEILITIPEWKAKKQSVRENYFNDILKDANGLEFVLSNQWTREGAQQMKICLDKVPNDHSEDKGFVNDNVFAISKSNVQGEPVFRMPGKGKLVYSINGGKDYFPAGAIGYYVIKRYLAEHSNANIEEIRQILPARVHNYKTIIDSSTWEETYAPGKQKHTRYVPFCFTDNKGNKFYVSNQWDKKNISGLEMLLSKLGWKIDKIVKG